MAYNFCFASISKNEQDVANSWAACMVITFMVVRLKYAVHIMVSEDRGTGCA